MLFLIIFLWTPPHFWALSLNRSDEYARASVPMLPVVSGSAATARQILIYSVFLVPVSTLPTILGFADLVYESRPSRAERCCSCSPCKYATAATSTGRLLAVSSHFLSSIYSYSLRPS